MAPRPEVILLDAMGTLITLRPPAPALRDELARRFGVLVTLAEAERALRAEIAYYREHLQEGRDPGALEILRARCAEVLRAALPSDRRLAAAAPEEMTAALLACLRFAPYPDARPALVAARARGQRLFVVSNWDCSLPEVLSQARLADLLDGVLSSATVGVPKPAPEIFARALALAACAPEVALHVGDRLEEDVAGARAAGIPALWLRRDGRPGPSGVPTIASLGELGRAAVT